MSRVLLPLFAVFVAGCSGDSKTSVTRIATTAAPMAGQDGARIQREAGKAGGAVDIPRKVIFNATLDLKVDDVEKAVAKLRTLVGQMNGYVSKADVSGSPGYRTGSLTARVPAKQFPAAVEQFATLGTVSRSASDSQDVTEEFIDVEARLKNYKAEEVALNKLLESSGGRLDDIFKIREQVARNRAEVERIEGRLKFLSNQTDLSTLTLTLREELAPGPPPPPPTFGERLTATFTRSVTNLREFAEELVLFVVAVGPWLPLLVLLGWLFVRAVRWLNRVTSVPIRRPRRPAPVPVAERLPADAIADVSPPSPSPEAVPAGGDRSDRTSAASP